MASLRTKQQQAPALWPIFRQANKAMKCCPTLMQAAKASHPECLSWHLKHGGSRPELLRHPRVRLPRPLHEAAGAKPRGQHPPSCTLCVQAIVAAGVNTSWVDERGRSPLQRAAMVGCVSCIAALLRSPTEVNNVNAICDGKSTALLEAVKVGAYDCIAPLLEAGALVNAAPDSPFDNPLLVAASENGDRTADILRLLVERGADVNATSTTQESSRRCGGQSALHASASRGCCSCIQVLLESGADPMVSDNLGRSPLHLATPDACRMLLNHIREVSGPSAVTAALLAKTKYGMTPWNAALGRRSWTGTCVSLFLEMGADPMAPDDEGNSPLHQAASNTNADACRVLVDQITKVSDAATATAALLAKNSNDRTILHQAVGSRLQAAKCTSMILELLKLSGGSQAVKAAMAEPTGEKGRTVVHLAASDERYTDCLRALTEVPEGLRVALTVTDNSGQTPVALAQQAGHDFDDIPGFAQVPWIPCCEGILDAAEKGHVTCVKRILKGGDSFATEGEDGIVSPLALVAHGRYGESSICSKILRLLLEAGFDPDGFQGDGFPLHHSTGMDDDSFEVCETCTSLLLHAGAKRLFVKDDSGDCAMDSILFYAFHNGEEGLARAALAAADLKDDEDGVTDLYKWAGTGNCFLEESLGLTRLLAQAGADIAARGRFGKTVLHVAVELDDFSVDEGFDDPSDSAEHSELLEFLVSKGAVVDAKDAAGDTPMHLAARMRFPNVVATLLNLGANPLLQNTDGDTPMHVAARAGCTSSVAHFVDTGVCVTTKGFGGDTPLHLASSSGDASCVQMLLEAGGDIQAQTDNGWTLLRKAASAQTSGALVYLLDQGKGELRQTLDGVGNLLHTAAYHGSTATMQVLVDRGLEVDSTIASSAETVLHNAAQNGQATSVKWLLDHGASLDVQDVVGMHPLVSAITRDTRNLEDDDRIARSVLQAVAETVDGEGSFSVVWEGMGLLHLASARGRPTCANFLLNRGAGVDSKTNDTDEHTPMHLATMNNRTNLAGVLANAGANMDARDAAGKTPLHLAAAIEAGLDMATILLDLGASCDIADNRGKTPLLAAAKLGHLACCSLLVARGADMTHRDVQGENALGASLVGPRSSRKSREAVMKLLIDLGCPVEEAEVDAASRGRLTGSFAKAIAARMSGGTSARQLVKASNMACKTAGAVVNVGQHLGGRASSGMVGPAVSMMAVRISTESAPTFSKRRRRAPRRRSESASKMSPREPASGKVYFVDTLRLRRAVSHLEGPDEVSKCLLLKLLLPSPAGWAESFRGSSGGRGETSGPVVDESNTDSESGRSGSAGPSRAPSPQPATSMVPHVELSCNGDDFDEAGFEAVMEYLTTGQVTGATCGSIHGDVPASGRRTTAPEVGLRALASDRAAAYFGLPRLQSMVRTWLKANGAEIEDGGTGVLAETWVAGEKRKFSSTHSSSAREDEEEEEEEEEHESGGDY